MRGSQPAPSPGQPRESGGHGRRQHRIWTAETDRTSAIAQAIAGDKDLTKRLLAEVGFPVQRLVRTDIGPIALGNQRPGSMRALDSKEIGALYKAVGM